MFPSGGVYEILVGPAPSRDANYNIVLKKPLRRGKPLFQGFRSPIFDEPGSRALLAVLAVRHSYSVE